MQDKIYRRPTQSSGDTPQKKRNEQNRKRNKYINFHVTKSEQDLIQRRRELSGLNHSEFYRQSLLYQRILVKGSIKTFAAMRTRITELEEHFMIPENQDLLSLDPAQLESLRVIMEIMEYITQKEKRMSSKRTYEERIADLESREEQLKKQKQELKAAWRQDERKKRNKRLINCGLAVREVLGRELTDEDAILLEEFLRKQERNGYYFTRAMNPEEKNEEQNRDFV